MEALIAYRGLCLTDNMEDFPSGIIVPVDKPYRWTSADVIRKLKYASCRHFHSKNLKVGHAGTLDPLATGVLLVCIGKATRLAQELQAHDKEYIAGVTFGATTASYDREKEIDGFYPLDAVSRENLEAVLGTFTGPQEQIAPLFSAKSVDGVRAYELARREFKAAAGRGESFDHSAAEMLSRQKITISTLRLLEWHDGAVVQPDDNEDPGFLAGRPNPRINVVDVSSLNLPSADILVECSKGTYIRALARDLGEALDSGAFLNSLRRTRTGGFKVEDALNIDEAMALFSADTTDCRH